MLQFQCLKLSTTTLLCKHIHQRFSRKGEESFEWNYVAPAFLKAGLRTRTTISTNRKLIKYGEGRRGLKQILHTEGGSTEQILGSSEQAGHSWGVWGGGWGFGVVGPSLSSTFHCVQ